jgi:hypothetical protein
MAHAWANVEEARKSVECSRGLRDLAASSIIRYKGATVFKDLIAPGLGDPSNDDLTGFEASTNKIHVADFVEGDPGGDVLVAQGVVFAEAVASRLAEVGEPARVVMSRDVHSGAVTVRFFMKRPAQPWGSDEPNDYQEEEVAFWDVGG